MAFIKAHTIAYKAAQPGAGTAPAPHPLEQLSIPASTTPLRRAVVDGKLVIDGVEAKCVDCLYCAPNPNPQCRDSYSSNAVCVRKRPPFAAYETAPELWCGKFEPKAPLGWLTNRSAT